MRGFPTRYGWLFIVALAGMLLGSINYNNNLGFLFTFLLGSMALVSVVHTYRNIRGIVVDTIRAQPVFETQNAVFEVTLQPSARKKIALRFRLGESQETGLDIAPDAGVQFSVVMSAHQRGRISLKKLHVTSEYPFGLFRFSRTIPVMSDCLVYPKPVPLHQLSMQDLLGAHSSREAASSHVDDFKGLRAFQNGDARQHIFWKAFSKGQGLLVKEFMGNTSPEICLKWDKIGSKRIEEKLSILCAMVLKAHSMKLVYGISLPGQTISPHRGIQHKHACLRALALF